MRFLLPLIILFVAGCQTKPLAPRPSPLPVAEIPAAADARIAAVVGHYTLGAYVDPDNDLIRHDAHAIQRLETEARWNLRTASVESPPSPRESIAIPADSPAAPAAVGTQPAAGRAETPASVPPTPVAVAAVASSSAASRPEPDLVNVIAPNADGFIDLTALPTAGDVEVNPFAVRNARTDATKEISLLIGGLVQGSNPCVLVNGSPVQPGDTLESLTLVRLESDAAVFRHDDRLIRLPVASKPARLRVAL